MFVDIEKLKKRLRDCGRVEYSPSFEKKCGSRDISPEIVKKYVEDPDNLVKAFLDRKENGDEVWKLIFDHSAHWKLGAYAKIKTNSIILYTAFTQRKKWDKKRWYKKTR